MLLGSHLSIAGGVPNAILAAGRYGFDAVAMFVRNQQMWHGPPLEKPVVEAFRRARKRLGIGPVIAHGSYLCNLAGRAEVRRRSMIAMADELDRCGRLGVEYYVIHPGSRPNRVEGICRIADGLNRLIGDLPHRRVRVLLETTAGMGNCLGATFEELADILSRVHRPNRFGVCLDTCHVFAAGYDLRGRGRCRRMLDRFDRVIGLDRLKAIHLNDSVGEFASRRDRHAHIGHGRIGLAGFAALAGDERLADVPMILETPKGIDAQGRDSDEINARLLRRIAGELRPDVEAIRTRRSGSRRVARRGEAPARPGRP